MPCLPFSHAGMTGFVCTTGRTKQCSACAGAGRFQCDWKVGKTKSGKVRRCDRYLCAGHATEVAPDKHLCPEHKRAYDQWRQQRGGNT